jgi:hypothetical protein
MFNLAKLMHKPSALAFRNSDDGRPDGGVLAGSTRA